MHPTIKSTHVSRPLKGFALAQLTLMLVAMLAFLGFAVYYGQVGLLQNELQKNANMAALIGAASLYDGPSTGAPVFSPGNGVTAATNAFNRAVGASVLLQNMQAQLSSVSRAGNIIQVQAQGRILTPFLTLVGISQIDVAVSGRAVAAKEVIGAIGPVNSTTPIRTVILRQPLLNGPGPDLHIRPAHSEGYILEACAGNSDCYYLGRASRAVNNGLTQDRNMGAQTTRVLYGEQFIDLGATQATYNAFVNKASLIKINDDRAEDAFVNGSRVLFTAPTAPNFGLIEVYHHSVLCEQTCVFPVGLQPMP